MLIQIKRGERHVPHFFCCIGYRFGSCFERLLEVLVESRKRSGSSCGSGTV
jgi:hypothetical protein